MDSQIRKIHHQLVNKEITCTDLVQERLDALKQNTNNTVNSLLDTSALDLAAKVDAKIANGDSIGLLEGIPFGIKDVYMVQGTYTTASSDLLKLQIRIYRNSHSKIIGCWRDTFSKRKLR